MASIGLARVAGILLLGVFALNLYIGLYDKILSTAPSHLYFNWALSGVTLIAAIILLVNPLSMVMVVAAGIVWPILYVGALGFDVVTKLCFDLPSSYCWPSRTAAFQYLILNNPNAPAQGWTLWPYTVPTLLGLLFIAWILSIWALVEIRRSRVIKARQSSSMPPTGTTTQPPPASSPGNPPPPS